MSSLGSQKAATYQLYYELFGGYLMRTVKSFISVFLLVSFLLIVSSYEAYSQSSQSISSKEKMTFFRDKSIALHQNQQLASKGIFSATVKSVDGTIVKFLEDNLVVDISKATIKENIFDSNETFPISSIKPGMLLNVNIFDIPSDLQSPLMANSVLIPSRKEIAIFGKSIEGIDLSKQTITLFNLEVQIDKKTRITNQQNNKLRLKDLKVGQIIQADLRIEQGIITSNFIFISSQKPNPSLPTGIVSALVSSVKDRQIGIFEDKIKLDFSKTVVGTDLVCEISRPLITANTSLSFPSFGDCPNRSQGLKVSDSDINSFDEITFESATIQDLDLANSNITIFNRSILINADTEIIKSTGKKTSIEKLKANKKVFLTAQLKNGKLVAKSISVLKKLSQDGASFIFLGSGKVCFTPNRDLTCD